MWKFGANKVTKLLRQAGDQYPLNYNLRRAKKISKLTPEDLTYSVGSTPLEKATIDEHARRVFSGRHAPRPGETVIPAMGSAENIAQPNRQLGKFFFRGNPVPGGKKEVTLFSRHPDVAAGYALGRSAGQYTKGTNRLFAFSKKDLKSFGESRADMWVTEKGPRELLKKKNRQLRKTVSAPGGVGHSDFITEDLSPLERKVFPSTNWNSTYEMPALVKKRRVPVGEYSVRATRMPSGDPAYAIRDVKGVPIERALRTKQAEDAKGIPDRSKTHDLPEIGYDDPNQEWEYGVHDHKAHVRGRHLDLRLGDPATGHAHSWALVGDMPKPGETGWAIRQPTHTIPYMDFKGTIPMGQYGAGKVSLKERDRVEVTRASPQHVSFNVYRGSGPEEFSLHQIHENKWRLYNRTLSRDRVDLPSAKPKYKEKKPEEVDVNDDSQVMAAKIDGAHNLFVFPKTGKQVRVLSYRPSERQTGIIEHTHKVPDVLGFKTPKSLRDSIFRGELYAVDKTTGEALKAKDVGGILNSNVWKSRKKQEELGALRAVVFDVVRYKGKDVEHLPYEEKLRILQAANQDTPEVFELPRLASTPGEKRKLLSDIKSGLVPETKEGVILWGKHQNTPPIKVKFRPEHDVYVRGFTEGTGKNKGRGIGAIRYSHSPSGPVVGTVGTGFSQAQRQHMYENPELYKGMVIKVKALDKYEGPDGGPGALRAPSFQGVHIDKNPQERLDSIKTASLNWGGLFEDEDLKRKWQIGGVAAGALGGLGLAAAMNPMARRGIGHSIKSLLKKRGTPPAEMSSGIPQEVLDRAAMIKKHLLDQGLDPTTARIGISGTGGTGKTTMARALSQEMGMGFKALDSAPDSASLFGRDLTKYFRRHPTPGGNIYEQTHLMTQVDPDKFDAIIRMHTQPGKVKNQLMQRGRGAQQWDLYNYPKIHRAIEEGFNRTKGVATDIAPGVQVKMRPQGGFGADELLRNRMQEVGLPHEGLGRHRMLTSLVSSGKTTPGLTPYIRWGRVGGAGATVGAGAGVGSLIADQGYESQNNQRLPVRMKDSVKGLLYGG